MNQPVTIPKPSASAPDEAIGPLRQMMLIRRFEEKSAELYTKEKIRGFLHLYIGEEAVAVGVMQAAYEAAADYAQNRTVFGQPISNYELTQVKLGRMAVIVQASRQFSYAVARLMGKGEGAMEASMVKAYVCKAAEWVTREALQIHGGYGYAEEYSVSRLYVDARVLSIFEGADETLCLKVIAKNLCDSANK